MVSSISKPHIIALCETWLFSDIPDSLISILGYSVYRCDRSDGRRGGGVCAYVRNDVSVKNVSPPYMPDICSEFLILELKQFDLTTLILYVTPSLNSSQLQAINDFIINVSDASTSSQFLIAGDLNHLNTLVLEQLLCMKQVVMTPTRKSAILDKILISEDMYSAYFSDLPGEADPVTIGPPLGNSDHCCVTLLSREQSVNLFRASVLRKFTVFVPVILINLRKCFVIIRGNLFIGVTCPLMTNVKCFMK